MPRYDRDRVVLAKIEGTYGVDSAPTGSVNAIQCTNLKINPLNASNVDRALVRPYFGASEQLVGIAFKEVSFDVEIAGSGTAGVAPAWGVLLRACGFAEALIASTRADYTPITNAMEAVTIHCFDSGVRHVLLGARGDWQVTMKVGETPKLNFRFQGIDGADTAVVNATPDYTGWKVPQVVTDANTPDFKLGGTVAPTGGPAITGGTDFASTGLMLQGGNSLAFTSLINLQEMDVTDRVVTGTIELDQTAAQEVSRMTDVKANTLSAISMLHGTVTGRKALVHIPAAQFLNPSKVELNGRRMGGYDIRCTPVSGNDEVRIVTSF